MFRILLPKNSNDRSFKISDKAPPKENFILCVIMLRFANLSSKISHPFRFALAIVYRSGFLLLRKTVYREKAPLKSKVIIVGSFLAGGAGKTPLVRELALRMKLENLRIAILCHAVAWDEFQMLFSEFGCSVFKTRNRYETARKIDGQFDMILCDGGLEDTRFANADVFVLRWNESAKRMADLIPCGKCVSLEKDHPEAKKIRCFRQADNLYEKKSAEKNWNVSFGISAIQNGDGKFLPKGAKCAVVTAIGDPERFAKDVEANEFFVARKVFLPDHSKRFVQALLAELLREFPIVMTEKDWARLSGQDKKNPRLFVARERVVVGDAFEDYLNALAGGAFKNPPSML